MSISPFSFREFGVSEVEFVPTPTTSPKPFLPTGRKKEEAAPPPPPPPSFSEDQMKAAERDGYQKGFLDGVIEGKNQAANEQTAIDTTLTELVEKFASHYAPLFNLYRDMLKVQAAQLPKIAHTIAKKVAGDALEKNSYAFIEEICLRCVNAMMHEPKLVITVHESMKTTLETKIGMAARALQMGSEITVVGDANITPANCRVEWKNGAMVRDTDSLWQQVEQVVANMVTSSENEAQALANAVETSQGLAPKGE